MAATGEVAVITRLLSGEEIMAAIKAYHSIPDNANIVFTSKEHINKAPGAVIKNYWTMENAIVTYEYRR